MRSLRFPSPWSGCCDDHLGKDITLHFSGVTVVLIGWLVASHRAPGSLTVQSGFLHLHVTLQRQHSEHTFPLSDWRGSTFPLLTKICEKLCREVSLLLCPLMCIVLSSPSSHQNSYFLLVSPHSSRVSSCKHKNINLGLFSLHLSNTRFLDYPVALLYLDI